MLKLIGSYRIPEWAIVYLINGDTEGLTEKEIECADNFIKDIEEQYNANRVVIDSELLDEEKYGNYYHNAADKFPAFGMEFGMTETWKLPVWVEVEHEHRTRYTIVVSGWVYSTDERKQKYSLNVIESIPFIDEDDAEIWVESYYDHYDELHYDIVNSNDFSYKFK